MAIVEICCGSYGDCLNAYKGLAHRIELNSALHLGGLTPSIGTLKLVKQNVSIPVVCMVRPRGAGFCYDDSELKVMMEDAKALLEEGADGIVFGILNRDGTIDIKHNKKMVELIHSYGKEAIFHRAFDCVKDPYQAMQSLIELGVDRVLTSGLENKAMEGKALIKDLQANYGKLIEIVAGSGVNHHNAKELMEYTGISQIHSSCKEWVNDPTTHMNPNVSYGYGPGNLESCFDAVSEKLVVQLVESVKNMRRLFELDCKDYDESLPLFIRPSVRGVIIKQDKIYMVHSLKYDYYKFPGGGIDEGETHVDALYREVLEEAGLKVLKNTVQEYGMVKRKQKGIVEAILIQDNFYYTCDVQDNILPQKLDSYEEEEQFTLELVSPYEAIDVNKHHDHGSKSCNMVFNNMVLREAKVLELLIEDGYFNTK